MVATAFTGTAVGTLVAGVPGHATADGWQSDQYVLEKVQQVPAGQQVCPA